ncbi:MAG TPA: DUF6585 family protein [Ktedonobacteraceae bacterium]|nr:DUF6585 family protein [Ktedonobacteraceae bacterium]
MTMRQRLVSPPLSLTTPTSRPACHDYRRAQRLAQRLQLGEYQAVFIDPRPEKAAQYRWGLHYPLICLSFLALVFVLQFFIPFEDGSLSMILYFCLLTLLFPYAIVALVVTALRRELFHCEQIHLYSNGFVAIDHRGRRQGAHWEQLFNLRRGGHKGDISTGALRWDMIQADISSPRRGQASTIKIAPRLHESVEIAALIERGYTNFWLPRFHEQYEAGEVLDFAVLLLHRDWLGKTTPGRRRFSPTIHPPSSTDQPTFVPGMARGQIVQADASTQVEWLRRSEIKSIRIDDRFILIRTIEPTRRDKQGRADRIWFQLDTLGLKDAAILKEILADFVGE